MKDFTYVTKNEIAVSTQEAVVSLMDVLMDNGYVVMVSREENLYIVNYIWSERDCDRNDVCFQRREEVEDFIFNCTDEEE